MLAFFLCMGPLGLGGFLLGVFSLARLQTSAGAISKTVALVGLLLNGYHVYTAVTILRAVGF